MLKVIKIKLKIKNINFNIDNINFVVYIIDKEINFEGDEQNSVQSTEPMSGMRTGIKNKQTQLQAMPNIHRRLVQSLQVLPSAQGAA